MGVVDAAPNCACQVHQGLVVRTKENLEPGPQRTTVRVELENAGDLTRLELVLERPSTAEPWRIADIRDRGASLVERLRAGLDARAPE